MLAGGCLAAGGEVGVLGPERTRSLFPAGVRFEVADISDRPRPDRDVAVVRRLARLLRAAAPDVVHAHGLRAGALAALALGRAGQALAVTGGPGAAGSGAGLATPGAARTGRPALVVTVHNAPPAGVLKAAVYAVLERLVARRAGLVLCVSADLADRMRRLGAGDVGLAVVPAPPARRSRWSDPRDRRHDPDVRQLLDEFSYLGQPLVLAAGRLTAQKGFDLLLAATARWSFWHGPRTRAWPQILIAGDGPDRAALAAKARQLGVEARFLGHRSDLPALLAAADVFVLPSRWEGQPLILQEALMAGRPIVAFDVGGIRAVAGEGAFLVPAGDVAALANAVYAVMTKPDLASRLSRQALARAGRLPTEHDAIRAVLDVYARLAAGGHPGGP